MDDRAVWVTIIGVALLILFLPFFVSLLGTMTFALMAFVACCGALVADLVSFTWVLAPSPADPTERAKHVIVFLMFWGCWLGAWIFAGVGIWRKRAEKRRNQADLLKFFPAIYGARTPRISTPTANS